MSGLQGDASGPLGTQVVACVSCSPRAVLMRKRLRCPKISIKSKQHPKCVMMQVFLKLGPRYDLGDQCPQEKDGWKFAMSGPDFAIWEKQ